MKCILCGIKCVKHKRKDKPLRHARKCPECGCYFETNFGALIRWLKDPFFYTRLKRALRNSEMEDVLEIRDDSEMEDDKDGIDV